MTDEELADALAAALGHYESDRGWDTYPRQTYACATCNEEFPCTESREIAERLVPVVHRYVVRLVTR